MYLHNAYESHGTRCTENEFFDRLARAFEFMESKREQQKLVNYGMATWLCFRAKSSEEKVYLSLQRVVELAEKVGGKDTHGFRYI